jgi:hypothetical protein
MPPRPEAVNLLADIVDDGPSGEGRR